MNRVQEESIPPKPQESGFPIEEANGERMFRKIF